MPPCQVQCVPTPQSRWLQMVILTANCTLACWFRNGFCCEYPRLNQTWFQLLAGAARPGHLHRLLIYKRFPYRRIRPPCPPPAGGVQTACCVNAIPTTLHVTCQGSTAALTYDGTRYWTGTVTPACGDSISVRLFCTAIGPGGANWGFEFNCGNGYIAANAVQSNCNPLQLTFRSLVTAGEGCTNCSGSIVTWVVTL